jgi:vacuolar-type H+-ATPase subunit H
MTINDIYQLAIEMGIKADPRGEVGIKDLLARRKKEYDELPEKAKKYFDVETLSNPFADTRILNGDPKTEVKKIISGIDVDTGEVVLTDRLKEKGEEYIDDAEKYISQARVKAVDMINEGKRRSERLIKDAKDKSDHIMKDAEKVYKDAKDKVTDSVKTGKESFEHKRDQIKDAIKAGVDAYKETKHTAE